MHPRVRQSRYHYTLRLGGSVSVSVSLPLLDARSVRHSLPTCARTKYVELEEAGKVTKIRQNGKFGELNWQKWPNLIPNVRPNCFAEMT